jgi:hypothetical protein
MASFSVISRELTELRELFRQKTGQKFPNGTRVIITPSGDPRPGTVVDYRPSPGGHRNSQGLLIHYYDIKFDRSGMTTGGWGEEQLVIE